MNAAGYALEIAWLRLLADAGCLTDEQLAQATTVVAQYTAALQTALQTAGFYDGPIDGIYGPSTVAAVEQLQTDNDLPVTGFVDEATAVALSAAVLAVDSEAATAAVAQTAAVQSVLKLAGYWPGDIDGEWTPELTEALKAFQTELGVEPTGAVDVATLHALQTAVAEGTSRCRRHDDHHVAAGRRTAAPRPTLSPRRPPRPPPRRHALGCDGGPLGTALAGVDGGRDRDGGGMRRVRTFGRVDRSVVGSRRRT